MSTDRGGMPAVLPDSSNVGEDTWDDAAPPRLTRRRFALHGGTTGALALPDDIATAKSAGFDAIEISDEKLMAFAAGGGELADVRTMLAGLELGALGFYGSPDRTAVTRWRDRAMRESWRGFCARAAAVGCTHVIVTPGVGDEADSAQMAERAAALGAMADVAAELALVTALEFHGFRGCAVRTLAAARDLVDRARAGVLVVIDAFHFHAGGSTWAMLDGLDAASVALVRLEDADARLPETLTDADRLLPGDGVIPLRDLVRRVEALGADVPYSVNLNVRGGDQRDERGYGQWGASRLATVARESAEALCAEVDEQDGRLDYA